MMGNAKTKRRGAMPRKVLGRVALVALAELAGSNVHGQIPCHYEAQIIPNVNCGLFQVTAIPTAVNNVGHVVGYFGQCRGDSYDSYLWTGGQTLNILPHPPGMAGF